MLPLPSLLRSDQLSEVIEHIPSECSNFETLIEEAVKQYRDATWRDVLTNLAVEPVSGALSKKERDAIKEKYTAFNEGFESIMATQRELNIPSRVRRLGGGGETGARAGGVCVAEVSCLMLRVLATVL